MKLLLLNLLLLLSSSIFAQNNIDWQYNLPQPEQPTITPSVAYFSMKKYATGTIPNPIPPNVPFDEYSAVTNGTKGLKLTGGNSGTSPLDPYATVTLTAANPILEVTLIPSTSCGVTLSGFSSSYKITNGSGLTSFNVYVKDGAAAKVLLGNFAVTADGTWQNVSVAGTYTSISASPTAGNLVVTFEGVGGTAGDVWALDNIHLVADLPLPCVLPINFENFTATEFDCKIKFQWKVLQEINVRNYDLEIMDKNGVFNSVAQLDATNNSAVHSYNTVVPSSRKELIARIKETDFDGKFTYSNTIKANISCQNSKAISLVNSISINKNVQVVFNNFTTNEKVNLSIYNTLGEIIAQKNIVINSGTILSEISTAALASGVYLLSATTATGEKYTERFIKK